MGVIYFYCKTCCECIGEYNGVQCRSCDQRIKYHNTEICERCILLERFDKNRITLTDTEKPFVIFMCDDCVRNSDNDYVPELCEEINDSKDCDTEIQLDHLKRVLKRQRKKYFNPNIDIYKDTIEKIIECLRKINV